MRRLLATVAIAGMLVAGVLAAAPASASPTGRCIAGQCGKVKNHPSSIEKLTVKRVGGTISLGIGGTTPSGYDWDALWIPPGRCVNWDAQGNPLVYASRVCVAPKLAGKWFAIPNDGTLRAAYIYRY